MLANTHPATRWPTAPAARTTAPGSVGLVQRQLAHFDSPLHLRSGGTLERFTLAYETYGTLNADRSNTILICHALSGDAHVAGYHTGHPDEKPGWWDDAVGPGKIFDTDRFFVICSNVIGGCQGSTGPSSPAPDGEPYALRFPMVTVADMVEAQRRLLDRLGIHTLFGVTGGSMGAMQALQWAVAHPDRVEHVLFLASTARSSALHIAFNETGRQAIYGRSELEQRRLLRRSRARKRAGRGAHGGAHHLHERSLAGAQVRAPSEPSRKAALYASRAGIRRRELPEPTRDASSSSASTPTATCTSPRPSTTSTSGRTTARCAPRSNRRGVRSWWSASPATGCTPPNRRWTWSSRFASWAARSSIITSKRRSATTRFWSRSTA